jgi:hypothetical protein
MQWKYSDMEASAARLLPPPPPPAFVRPDEALLKRRTTYVGTTDALVEALLDIRRRSPMPVEFVTRSYLPLLDHAAQLELIAELAEGVAPHV